jgi:hypothetical protein
VERDKPYIRLCLPVDSTLVQGARYLGAHDLGTYAWQIRLVDVGALLRVLSPVLERRVAASALAGLTANVCLNLYREAFEMRFLGGQLVAVEALGFCDRGGIRLPPQLAAPLILGHRTWKELRHAYPDVSVSAEWQQLVDVLFPRMRSYLYTVY